MVVLLYQLYNYKIFTKPYKLLTKIYYCPFSFSLSLQIKKGREGKIEISIKGDTLWFIFRFAYTLGKVDIDR